MNYTFKEVSVKQMIIVSKHYLDNKINLFEEKYEGKKILLQKIIINFYYYKYKPLNHDQTCKCHHFTSCSMDNLCNLLQIYIWINNTILKTILKINMYSIM